MDYDAIEFYSNDEVKAWYAEFLRGNHDDSVHIPGIPFSYYEIRDELLRRERMEE